MSFITKKEGIFLLLFIRNGYVLNFTDNTFDVFTTASVGEAIKTKYGLSKEKSLVEYLNDVEDTERTKLIVDRLDGSAYVITQTAESLKIKFSSEYLSNQKQK